MCKYDVMIASLLHLLILTTGCKINDDNLKMENRVENGSSMEVQWNFNADIKLGGYVDSVSLDTT